MGLCKGLRTLCREVIFEGSRFNVVDWKWSPPVLGLTLSTRLWCRMVTFRLTGSLIPGCSFKMSKFDNLNISSNWKTIGPVPLHRRIHLVASSENHTYAFVSQLPISAVPQNALLSTFDMCSPSAVIWAVGISQTNTKWQLYSNGGRFLNCSVLSWTPQRKGRDG